MSGTYPGTDLIAAVAELSRRQRELAVAISGKLRAVEIALIAALQEAPVEMRLAVVRALGEAGAEIADPELTEGISDEERESFAFTAERIVDFIDVTPSGANG